ncbi:GNAT family N-acetyltransferase [Nocardiopsis algeriensis]|uniref:Ribosomal protein S18 acetylase RimI-like enzyme n=1 Tax=Nocardiopsis algeriensis TaxID=1478215 RepID=A0A841IQI5_9ACTN|nr:GNAT family N-acetyltransferase [Nocardiopsis algeriensis]MBB6118905.1 ribosomal protein S18 acetylase RimI-like enzyme [Nocardiopsis algeriensis]
MTPILTKADRPAALDDVPSIVRVMGGALYDTPFFRWLFPDDATRVARTRRFFALTAGFGYVPFGDTRVAEAAEEPDGPPSVRGAALWAAAGHTPESRLVSLRTWPHWAELIGRDRRGAFLRVFAEWKMAEPQEPHLYLAALGVDPAFSGNGIAKGLLTAGLERADAEGLPVFTQVLDPKSVGLYEAFGFRVVRESASMDGVTSHSLLRDRR